MRLVSTARCTDMALDAPRSALKRQGYGVNSFVRLLQDAVKHWGHKIPAEDVVAIMAAADVDGDGVIDYNEFVAATMNVNQLEKEDLIYKAFQQFDEDGSESISMDELEKACLRQP